MVLTLIVKVIFLLRKLGKLEGLPLATAAHNTGGIVIAQVKRIVEDGTINAKCICTQVCWWTMLL